MQNVGYKQIKVNLIKRHQISVEFNITFEAGNRLQIYKGMLPVLAWTFIILNTSQELLFKDETDFITSYIILRKLCLDLFNFSVLVHDLFFFFGLID